MLIKKKNPFALNALNFGNFIWNSCYCCGQRNVVWPFSAAQSSDRRNPCGLESKVIRIIIYFVKQLEQERGSSLSNWSFEGLEGSLGSEGWNSKSW